MNSFGQIAVGIILLLLNAFFVAAEYTLVACRRQKIEALSKKKGGGRADLILSALQNKGKYVASAQIGVTLASLAIGSQIEPALGKFLEGLMGTAIPRVISGAFSLIVTVYITVVLGELVPKYASLANPEKMAMFLIRPFHFCSIIFSPLAKFAELSGKFVLSPFLPKSSFNDDEKVSMEELMLMVRTGSNEGVIDEAHANVVSKALRFDNLDSSDIMVHRIDIHWIDSNTPWSEIINVMQGQTHTRIPVCNGDIDEVVGILYANDIINNLNNSETSLLELCREPVLIPENLTLSKIIERMRESRTQILIVADEYGGTSGLITLEDVIEEVFGELEDQLESDRPTIDRTATNRLSVRGEVRIDELQEFLGYKDHDPEITETLAELMIEKLERMPKMGDRVESIFGSLIVENMARRRITRIRVLLTEKDTINS